MADKKYPGKIILKKYPYGLVSSVNPSIHYSFDDPIDLIKEIASHPNTKYFLDSAKPSNRITTNGKNIFVNGKQADKPKEGESNILSASNNKKNIVYDEYDFGWANLAEPSKHYSLEEVKKYIQTHPNKRFFIHDFNTRITISKNNEIIKHKRYFRIFLFWTIVSLLGLIVPVFVMFSMLIGSLYLLVHQEKGKRPTQFASGFGMQLWFNNRARLFMSRNTLKINTEGNGVSQETYKNMLNAISNDDLYVMVAGTLLFSDLIVPEGTSSTYYLPAQQIEKKDSDGVGTGQYYSENRAMTPIYNLYSKAINILVTDLNRTTGEFSVNFTYEYGFTIDESNHGIYIADFSADLKLGLGFKENTKHVNQNLWNWELQPASTGSATLTWTIKEQTGNIATIAPSTFESSIYTSDFDHYEVPSSAASNSAYLPSLINTNPSEHNLIINTANVYIRWTINGIKDTNNQ